MSNSPLVSYTKISPNRTSPRNHKIDTITIHCVVGQCSVETLGNIFARDSRDASSNYGIGSDGRVGMYVEEKDRSWCSSNADNDNRAITIEVASDTTHPYAVNDAAYKSLIALLTDICQRNDIKKLLWKGDKSLIGQPDKQNMTVHRWFAAKSCPGEYLYSRHAQIAAEVNERLKNYDFSKEESTEETKKPETKPVTKPETKPVTKPETKPSKPVTATKIGVGDTISLSKDAKYYNGKNVPSWVTKKQWIVKSVSGERVVIDKSADGKNAINSAVHADYVTVTKTKPETPYMVKIEASTLNIRKGPGTNYAKTGKITGGGVYTIVEVQKGKGSNSGWGLLKSKAGWISLDYAKKI